MDQIGISYSAPLRDPAPLPSEGPGELATEHPSTKDPVYYRHIEYDPPLPKFEFVKPTGDIDGPPGPKPPPRVVEFVKPEPKAPVPSESRSACCSTSVVKISCLMGGIVTTMVGFAAIATRVHFEAGMGIGAAGAVVALGVAIWHFRSDR